MSGVGSHRGEQQSGCQHRQSEHSDGYSLPGRAFVKGLAKETGGKREERYGERKSRFSRRKMRSTWSRSSVRLLWAIQAAPIVRKLTRYTK